MKSLTLALGFLIAGCNFSVAGDKGDGGGGAGGGGDDLAMSMGDDLGEPPDLGPSTDIAGLPIVCTAGSASCSSGTLVTCPDGTAQVSTTCPLGCSDTGGSHCEVLYPRAPVTRTDFDTTGLSAVTVPTGTGIGISTESGLIGAGVATLRHANTDPNTYEVHDGIGFHVVAIPGQNTKLGIYTFKSLTVSQGQSMNAYGANGLALVSAGDMTITGTVDVTCAANVFLAGGGATAKPNLAGPGGGDGGPSGNNDGVSVQPKGGGSAADKSSQAGGGGGAFADIGGPGGDAGSKRGGAGGTAYGDPTLAMLFGGSGGASGGLGGGALIGSVGGGGGGVALLVAQGTLTLGGGTMVGGVNAGGCGGTAALNSGGAGGGAGGAIFLQALTVHIATNGVAAANGGGGSAANVGAGPAGNGGDGALSATAAKGGNGGPMGASGGDGGAAGTVAGSTGGTDGNNFGGGGGGSAGRIRIESQSGAATIDGMQSPAASQGTVDIH